MVAINYLIAFSYIVALRNMAAVYQIVAVNYNVTFGDSCKSVAVLQYSTWLQLTGLLLSVYSVAVVRMVAVDQIVEVSYIIANFMTAILEILGNSDHPKNLYHLNYFAK